MKPKKMMICDHMFKCTSKTCDGKKVHEHIGGCARRYCDNVDELVKCVEVKGEE